MARWGSPKIRGHGIPEALEAILIGRSRLDAKVAVLKPVSSAVSIGTGGPFGAEGPIIMTGGAFGSLFAQLFHLSAAERKTLLVAGAAAGMAAVFASPDRGDAARRRASPLRVEAAQLHPRRRRRGRGRRRRASRCSAPGPVFPVQPHGPAARRRPRRRGRPRNRRGLRLGTAHGARLRMRGSLPEASDPLDVVAGDRRTRASASAASSIRASSASATGRSTRCSPADVGAESRGEPRGHEVAWSGRSRSAPARRAASSRRCS